MGTFAITSTDDLLNAVNYAVSNLGSATGVLANNTLSLNSTTNAITVGVGGQIYSYNVPWLNVRYANNATGTSGFTNSPANSTYYGLQATANAVPATIDTPASYSWYQVPGGTKAVKSTEGSKVIELGEGHFLSLLTLPHITDIIKDSRKADNGKKD